VEGCLGAGGEGVGEMRGGGDRGINYPSSNGLTLNTQGNTADVILGK